FRLLYGIAASDRARVLGGKQISKRELVSALRIAGVGVPQVTEITNRCSSITLGQIENAVPEHRVIVDRILSEDVLHARGAILILLLRTGHFHQVDAGR